MAVKRSKSVARSHAGDYLTSVLTAWEIGVMAPQVVALRTSRIALSMCYPNLAAQREITRMTSEKAGAWIQAVNSMTTEAALETLRWCMPGRARDSLGFCSTMAKKGLAPAHRKVKANLRRLSKRR